MNSRLAALMLAATVGLVASTGCTSSCGCVVPDTSAPAAKSVVAVAVPAPPATPTPPRAPLPELPAPPGTANVPRPSGAPDNLKVLDWAGFKSAVSYTFDDGQPSQLEHYDDLQATGVRLTFFINSGGASWQPDFVSTFSRAVRDGHEIGNHTVHHCHADPDGTLYTGTGTQRAACAGASTAAEFDDCTAFISEKLGAPQVWSAAWPFGDAGYAAVATARFLLSRGAGPGTVAP
ncbi:MAG TPA: polysaccharide deacetylase family protein, partial [Polyangia bacterium]